METPTDNLANQGIIGGQVTPNHQHNGNDGQKVFMKDLAWLKVNYQPLLGLELPNGQDGEMRLYYNTLNSPAGSEGAWIAIFMNGAWYGWHATDTIPL